MLSTGAQAEPPPGQLSLLGDEGCYYYLTSSAQIVQSCSSWDIQHDWEC